MPEKKTGGYVQIYTGAGKGKTTAALGLILRASGAGKRIFLGQFIKGRRCSEHTVLLERFPEVVSRQFGSGCFVIGEPSVEDLALAESGLHEIENAVSSGLYDLVIADEINCCVKAGLLSVEQVKNLILKKHGATELILTGRDAHPEVIAMADLVTEMKAVRHYFDKNIPARRGIEF